MKTNLSSRQRRPRRVSGRQTQQQRKGSPLGDSMRAAARRLGLTLEGLRLSMKPPMSGGLFYGLLRGERPKKLETLDRLRAAHIEVPRDLAA